MALVTLAQVDLALRLDLEQEGSPPEFIDARTPDIELKIEQAEAAVLAYLKVDEDSFEGVIPPQVTAAVIMGVRSLLLGGPDDLLGGLKDNERGNPIVSLLWGLRDPAMA